MIAAAPSMSRWASDREISRVVGADAMPRIVAASAACPDSAAIVTVHTSRYGTRTNADERG